MGRDQRMHAMGRPFHMQQIKVLDVMVDLSPEAI